MRRFELNDETHRILSDWAEGDRQDFDRLVSQLYSDLRRMACLYSSNQRTRRFGRSDTLQPTAMVNELFIRLERCRGYDFENREEFWAFVAKIFGRILADYARERTRQKRGGSAAHLPLDEGLSKALGSCETLRYEVDPIKVIAVERALEELEICSPRQAALVRHRFFAGMTLKEAAGVAGVSLITAKRDWAFAKRWLALNLDRHEPAPVAVN